MTMNLPKHTILWADDGPDELPLMQTAFQDLNSIYKIAHVLTACRCSSIWTVPTLVQTLVEPTRLLLQHINYDLERIILKAVFYYI